MENSKKLVVYYSYTGHTKMIAKRIEEKLGCDILEIKPIIPYSTNYQTVVNKEQNNESSNKTPQIEKIDKDLKKYDEIIIGSPVWWYTIAPVIRTFLKQNDLSGKTIKPFATNAGWLGQTFKEIKKLCPNSNVKEGMNIVFTEDYNKNELVTPIDEIDNWILD
ncbi:MAG: flavodoxin [Clostridia bacterium]|jgi:flavodoxin